MKEEGRYGIAGEFLQAVEPYTEADPHALITQLHAGFGNLAGRSAHQMVEKTRHGANIFVLTVGDTAKARKGTSWEQCLDTLRRVDKGWAADRLESGLSSGEGLIAAVRDASNGDPGVSDKRVLFFEGDFVRTLRAMSRTGNTLSPVVRNSWDGGDLRVTTRHSPLKATGAHVSIVAHTTQFELLENLSKADMLSGLGNRFLVIGARRSKLLAFGGDAPSSVLREIASRLKTAAAFARQVGAMRLSQKARQLWKEEYPRLSAPSPGLLGAMTSRAEPQVLRLAMISALMNESEEIKTPHLRAGLAIWEYALASARYLFGDKQEVNLDRRILRILREAKGGLARTQISAALNHHASGAAITSSLGRLKRQGLVEPQIKKTRGRPMERSCAV
jgi:hypothetical protein